MNGRVANESMEDRREARKATSAAIWTGTVTKTKDPTDNKGKGKGKGRKTRLRRLAESKGHIGVHCPYSWTNSIDEEDGPQVHFMGK